MRVCVFPWMVAWPEWLHLRRSRNPSSAHFRSFPVARDDADADASLGRHGVTNKHRRRPDARWDRVHPPIHATWQSDDLRGRATDDLRLRHERNATRAILGPCRGCDCHRIGPFRRVGWDNREMGIAETSADLLPGDHPDPHAPALGVSGDGSATSTSTGPCFAPDAGIVKCGFPDPANRTGLPEEFGCFRSVMGYEEISI